jgi:hypothetical protein
VAETLLTSAPTQSCEYLYKRTIGTRDQKVLSRLISSSPETPAGLDSFINLTQTKYGQPNNYGEARRGAMFLRRALKGDLLNLEGVNIQLSQRARLHISMSGIVYSARNDRVHGDSFSPFISSKATLRTYTHPNYMFLCAYYFLLLTWAHSNSPSFPLDPSSIHDNLAANLAEARTLFGRHWLG